MACYYYTPEERKDLELKELRKELDTATRILCAWCTEEEQHGNEVPEVAKAWWARHQAQDEERALAEAEEARHKEKVEADKKARKKLIDGLSDENRRLLGVKP